MKELAAAKRLLKDCPDYQSLTPLLDGALTGCHYASPPDCLAAFKPTKYTAANRKASAPAAIQPSDTERESKLAELQKERDRIARQTDCAAELRYKQRDAKECGTKDECRGCPQRKSVEWKDGKPADPEFKKLSDLIPYEGKPM